MNLYLKVPTIEDRLEWLNYITEYNITNPKEYPLNYTEQSSYDTWLEETTVSRNAKIKCNGLVPTSVFFLMKDNKIVGHLSIRHSIDTDFLSTVGGHIVYGIRPNDRKNGYGTVILKLAILECVNLGLKKVLITCKKTNIGSKRIIEKNGGILKDIYFNVYDNCNYLRYEIKL